MEFKFFAFISYSHQDMAVVKRIQRQLEKFKLPTYISNEIDSTNRYLQPIFRDESDMSGGGILKQELIDNLDHSKYLIVICSNYSIQSEWVNNEISHFIDIGREEYIIPVIISSLPSKSFFPLSLFEYIESNPDKELLGIQYTKQNKQEAIVKIVSHMLQIPFDTLWKRHIRQRRYKIIRRSILAFLILLVSGLFAVPSSQTYKIIFEKPTLPLPNGLIIKIDESVFNYPIKDTIIVKNNQPGYKRFKYINVKISSNLFLPMDTFVKPSLINHPVYAIKLRRDSTFSNYSGYVYDTDMNPLDDVKISIKGIESKTTKSGLFQIALPIDKQEIESSFSIYKQGYECVIKESLITAPSSNIVLIMKKSNK